MVNKTLVVTVIGFVLFILSLILLFSPEYVSSFWSPVEDQKYPDYEYPDDMNASPECVSCTPSSTNPCQFFAQAKTVPNPNVTTCTPGITGDRTCMLAMQSCEAYCAVATAFTGYCVAKQENTCAATMSNGRYTQQCQYGANWQSKGTPYVNGNTPQGEEAKANTVMNYWESAGNSLDFEGIAQWATPPFLLVLLSFIDTRYYKGGWQFLAAVVATFLAFINSILAFLYVWIATSLIRKIVFPPEYAQLAFGDAAYGGARATVAGLWFMWFAQLIFLVVGILWIRANNVGAEGKPLV
jgi:hypothetical protein